MQNPQIAPTNISPGSALQDLTQVPVIDISPLVARTSDRHPVAIQIRQACRDSGMAKILTKKGHLI